MDGITITVSVDVPVAPVVVTDRVLSVAALFGLGVDSGAAAERVRILPRVELCLRLGEVVLITGESGAGKSTLLRAVEREIRAARERWEVVRLEEIELAGDRAVVDCFACSLEEALGHLARAGLSDAHVLMRSPMQLSEGQRFRYRLARFFASEARVLIADEFCATLDRVTAKGVAFQVGKFVRRSAAGDQPRLVLLATTHDDLSADLRADQHLHIRLGGVVTFTTESQRDGGRTETEGIGNRR